MQDAVCVFGVEVTVMELQPEIPGFCPASLHPGLDPGKCFTEAPILQAYWVSSPFMVLSVWATEREPRPSLSDRAHTPESFIEDGAELLARTVSVCSRHDPVQLTGIRTQGGRARAQARVQRAIMQLERTGEAGHGKTHHLLPLAQIIR